MRCGSVVEFVWSGVLTEWLGKIAWKSLRMEVCFKNKIRDDMGAG